MCPSSKHQLTAKQLLQNHECQTLTTTSDQNDISHLQNASLSEIITEHLNEMIVDICSISIVP